MSSVTPKSCTTCTDPAERGASVAAALRSRSSVRAYRPETPPLETIRAVLDVARWSPSASNMQPWKVIAIAGPERDAVCRLARMRVIGGANEEGDHPVLPLALRREFRGRRNSAAALRLQAQGIARSDTASREATIMRNYDFFGAPVGLFFVTGRELVHGQ